VPVRGAEEIEVRAFVVRLPSGVRYWTVLDDSLAVVAEADAFLRHIRFGRAGPGRDAAPAAARVRQQPDAGSGLDEVAELLGHASMSSSQGYLHQGSEVASDGRETAGRLISATSEWPSSSAA
jgi:hypothetical protein